MKELLDLFLRSGMARSLRLQAWAWTGVLLCAGATFVPAGDVPKDSSNKPSPDQPPVTLDEGDNELLNWGRLTLGGSVVNGNKAAFQQRTGRPAGTLWGGVDEFHWEHELTNKWTLKLDGRGLFDYHDYAVKLELRREDRGFLRAGYTESRSYFNGSGGYLPGAGTWEPLAEPELFLDHGNVWVEVGLTLKKWPRFRFKYTHDFKDGRKDSTIWGRVNTPYGMRGLAASFYDFDEKRDTLEGEVTHTIGKTDLGIKLVYEWAGRDNSFNSREFAGTPNSFMTQREGSDSGLFNVHAWSSTWFNKRTALSTGYGFTRLDTDLTGSRVYGDQFDPVYDPAVLRGPGFINLSGGALLNQHVANVSFMTWPSSNLALVPMVRFEYQEVEGVSLYQPFNPGVTAGVDLGGVIIPDPAATGYVATDSSRRQTTFGPRLELRYNGITNWLFYTLGEWEVSDGDMQERSGAVDMNVLFLPADAGLRRASDYQRFEQKYTVGAHWYPARKLSLSAEYYFKKVNHQYDHRLDSTPNNVLSFNLYPAFLRKNNFDTHDANVRITWRPRPSFTAITRYDYQFSTVETGADGLATLESAQLHTHLISQSVTWSPVDRLYLQGSIQFVFDTTRTPVSAGANSGLVQKSRNDYWFATLGAGYALGPRTDVLADYSYYRADNWDAGNAPLSVPYGMSAREHVVSAGIVQRFSRKVRAMFRYSYFQSDDETSGGNNDFTAHVLSGGLQYRF